MSIGGKGKTAAWLVMHEEAVAEPSFHQAEERQQ